MLSELPDRILLATRNRGKLREIRHLLSGLEVDLPGLDDIPGAPELDEPHLTFKANAVHKARTAAAATGMWTLADDSGLEIDALEGFPGVASSRFAGPNATDADRNGAILAQMRDVPPEGRTARFVCVVALCVPQGAIAVWRGTCEGLIADSPRGTGGFGYDPLFYVPSHGMTMAEMPPETKNELSHRSAAFLQAVRDLASDDMRFRRRAGRGGG